MTNLPEIEIWKTRSFWLTLATVAAALAKPLGLEVDPDGTADAAMTIVEILPAITGLLAYREAIKPAKRVWVK